jgi:hypothetical protein
MKYNEQLLESFGLREGLYRSAVSNEVVDLLCVGPAVQDPTEKVAIVRRKGLESVWVMPIETFCMDYVKVLGVSYSAF